MEWYNNYSSNSRHCDKVISTLVVLYLIMFHQYILIAGYLLSLDIRNFSVDLSSQVQWPVIDQRKTHAMVDVHSTIRLILDLLWTIFVVYSTTEFISIQTSLQYRHHCNTYSSTNDLCGAYACVVDLIDIIYISPAALALYVEIVAEIFSVVSQMMVNSINKSIHPLDKCLHVATT